MFDWFWNDILWRPVRWIGETFGVDVTTPWIATGLRLAVLVAALGLLYEIYLRVTGWRRRKRRQAMFDEVIPEQGLVKDTSFSEQIEAAHAPEQTLAALKRRKQWARAGELCATLNRNKEAARLFRKAGDKPRAAMEWAKAGKTLKAARMLYRLGDYATAARFYSETGRHLKAAKAFNRLNDLPNAAGAYAHAKKYKEASAAFLAFFAASGQTEEANMHAADLCHAMLQTPEARQQLPPEQLRTLSTAVAERFAAAKRNDLAAKLFADAGVYDRAGSIYYQLGRLEPAAEFMERAGRHKEAAEIRGRWYESNGAWREAAKAYEKAGKYLRAGDAYSKAVDPLQAAQCYERAGEHFGAGFALVHADRWEHAVRMFQRVPEESKNYNESRALLGRCFYELQNYAQCVAALENHLTGERVRSATIEYFWMLGLAYEQLGELEKAREVFLKIRSVNVGFRDVAQRLSNVETRISMLGSKRSGPGALPQDSGTPDSEKHTAVMTMVENQLGQRYKLDKELGRGGMGVVYLARDTQLDRPVALKFLGAVVDGNEEFQKRFTREAKAAAKVSHPNIVSIYEISTQEGRAFIAMEYVEGANLHRYLRHKQKLSPREAVNIIAQACSALDVVHEAGIVHRDIKPDNIVIAKGGLVKLMDFGLAKTADNRLTGGNVVMGTPSYMSPEQTRGEDVDQRTDIYAIGLVFHELLTGKIVFGSGEVVKRQQEETPPPPSALVEGIPPDLDALIMKCIEKDKEKRFATAKELLAALRELSQHADAGGA